MLVLSYRTISGGFYLVDFSPCLPMWRYTIVVLIEFYRCFFMSFYVRPVQVLRKPCFIALRRLDFVGLKSSAWRYCASSNFVVWDRMLFATMSYCCFSGGPSQIPVCLFLVPFMIRFPFLGAGISCLSSVMVHPSSHKTPNEISGFIFIFGIMWICLACLLRPGSWSVAICDDYIVLPYRSLDIVSFDIMTGAIFLVAFSTMCIFAPGLRLLTCFY